MEDSSQESPPTTNTIVAQRGTLYRRSNGGWFLTLGSIAVAIALLLIVVGLNGMSRSSYDTDAIHEGWAVVAFASGLLSLGIFLLAIGSIIRALWFLPGEEEKQVIVKRRV